MNIQTQSVAFINALESRRRKPPKPGTLQRYQSYLRTWIVPLCGAEDLANFDNGAMKKFVSSIAGELKPASVMGIVNCLKGVIASATDKNGNELYPRTWNADFIDLPEVIPSEQAAPTITQEALQEAISRSQGQFKPLYITLAGTGLRISECLALRAGLDDSKGSFWLPEQGKLVIRDQVQDGLSAAPKTTAGTREVDIIPEISDTLRAISSPAGNIFNMKRDNTYRTLKADGVPGHHSLRRFRTTRLREVGTPEDILKFWIGHSANRDITDRYSKLAQNTVLRKEWAQKAGLGFSIK
jgi:hypothetical protein